MRLENRETDFSKKSASIRYTIFLENNFLFQKKNRFKSIGRFLRESLVTIRIN